MAVYTYVKVVDAVQLLSEIGNTPVAPLISSVSAVKNVVTVTTLAALSQVQQSVVRDVLVRHKPLSPTEKVIDKRLLDARNYGSQLMSEYARQNVLKGITPEQARMVSERLALVQQLMASGSLYAVLDELAKITPDYWFSEADIYKYSAKIKAFLGVA